MQPSEDGYHRDHKGMHMVSNYTIYNDHIVYVMNESEPSMYKSWYWSVMYERDSLRIEAAVSGSFGVNSSSTLAGGKVKNIPYKMLDICNDAVFLFLHNTLITGDRM